MTTTSIIEIREQLANVKYENGRFSLNLKNHLTLNEGDELNIRNIYIDSKKESNTVSIPEDITLTMEICRGWTFNSDYIVHYGNEDGFGDVSNDKHLYLVKHQIATGNYVLEDGGFVSASDAPDRGVRAVVNLQEQANSTGRGDSMTYYPCFLYDAVAGDYSKLTEMQISVNTVKLPNFGGFTGIFEYIDAAGNKSKISLDIPQKSSNIVFFNFLIPNGIIYRQAESLTLIHPSPEDARTIYNVSSFVPIGEPVNTNKILHPKTQTINIPIKAGNYQPSILAEKINFYANNLNYALIAFDSQQVISSTGPIFQGQENSIYGDLKEGGDAGGKFIFSPLNSGPNNNNGIGEFYHLVSEDDSNVMLKMGTEIEGGALTNPLMGGASTFEIVFDDITQTFKITNLHTPYYVSIGNVSQIGVKLQDFNVSGIGKIMTMSTKRADLKIISLTTNEKTGNFWFDGLGFDESILTPIGSKLRNYDGTTSFLNAPFFNYDVKNDLGIRRTDAYVSSQIQLQNERFNPDYLAFSGDGNSPTPLLAPTTDTINIYGTKTLNDLIVNDAYFKVIINGTPLSNKLYDEENVKLISAIVGKYYSGDSYTNGFSSDGITYIHKGLPITLSNFNIDILSSKNTRPNIGDDNSIIIQVNKAEQEANK